MLGGQFAALVPDVACAVKCQVSTGLQPTTGVIEGVSGDSDLMAAQRGAVAVIPVAIGAYAECAARIKQAVGIAQCLLGCQVSITLGYHFALGVVDLLCRQHQRLAADFTRAIVYCSRRV